ncbi:MAG TPA: sigma-54 dependent transcriptional regulator [Gemmatimonadales bacterium]
MMVVEEGAQGECPLEMIRELRRDGQSFPVLIVPPPREPAAGNAWPRPSEEGFSSEQVVRKVEELVAAAAGGAGEPLPPGGAEPIPGLVGRSPQMHAVHEQVVVFAGAELNTLIIGETGVGKERVARAIHALSRRANRPFISINCANLDPALIESELFGHVAGAFTDAKKSTTGLLREAQGGVAFLDEVAELHASCQAKLLRVIEERELRPVGGVHATPIDVRFISATNESLLQAVRSRRFREDLYHRLAVGTIKVPPLRERLVDLPELVAHILARASGAGRARRSISWRAMSRLLTHHWSGNVRELENVLDLAMAYAGRGEIDVHHIRLPEDENGQPSRTTLESVVRSAERAHLLAALRATQWRKAEAARMLEIARTTLNRKIEEYGLEQESPAHVDRSDP